MREINRRELLGVGAGVVAGGLLPGFTKAGEKKSAFKLRYVLGSCMYGEMPLAEILPEVKKTGSEAIDIWPRKHGNQREQIEEMGHAAFLKLLDKHGVKLGMITRYDLGPKRLQEDLPNLKKFGGQLMITGSTKQKKGEKLKLQVQAFLKSLQPQIAVAEKLGVKIGIENHGNALINSPDSLRYFADLAESPHVGIAMAPYHLPQDSKLLADLIEHLGPKLAHFYAWEHGMGCMTKLPKEQELMQLPGKGSFDFGPLLKSLQKIQYPGWVEVFMHPVPRGIPILPKVAQVTQLINQSRDHLQQKLEAKS